MLSLAEWDALNEEASRSFELVDGVLHATPRPTTRHQITLKRLAAQLDAQLEPLGLECVPEVDVVLVESFPPVVRAPDLCVVSSAVLATEPDRLRPDQIVLVIEIVSPGSVRTDRVAKLSDYAQAGIPNYWIVDGVSLEAYRLVGSVHELAARGEAGVLRLTEPAPLTIELDALVA